MKLEVKDTTCKFFIKLLTSHEINSEIIVIINSLWWIQSMVNITSCLKLKVGVLLQQR